MAIGRLAAAAMAVLILTGCDSAGVSPGDRVVIELVRERASDPSGYVIGVVTDEPRDGKAHVKVRDVQIPPGAPRIGLPVWPGDVAAVALDKIHTGEAAVQLRERIEATWR